MNINPAPIPTLQPQPRSAGAGAILSEAWRLYTKRARAWIMPALIIQLPLLLLLVTGVLVWAYMVMDLVASDELLYGGFAPFGTIMMSYLGILLLTGAGSLLLGVPSTYAQYVALLEEDLDGMQALRFTFKRYGRALGHSMIYSLIISAASWVVSFIIQMFSQLFGIATVSGMAAGITSGWGGFFAPAMIGGMSIFLLVSIAAGVIINAIFSLILPISVTSGAPLGQVFSRAMREMKGVLLGGSIAHFVINLVLVVILVACVVALCVVIFSIASPWMVYGNVPDAEALRFFESLLPPIIGFTLVMSAFGLLVSPLLLAVQCAMHRLSRPQ